MASNTIQVKAKGYSTPDAYTFKIEANETGNMSGASREIRATLSCIAKQPGGYETFRGPMAYIITDGTTRSNAQIKDIWPRGKWITLVSWTGYLTAGQSHTITGRYNSNIDNYSYMPASGNRDVSVTLSMPYVVSYDANGGIGAPSAQTKEYDETLTLSTIKPSRDNSVSTGYTITLNANGGYVSTNSLVQQNTNSYSFESWNTNSSGTGTTYNPGGSYAANANMTLYAIWNTSITKGSVTLPTPTRANYSFVGWGTTASATTGVVGTITPTSSQTLYAVWKKPPGLVNWRDSAGNFMSGGTISIKDSNGKWVVINKIKIKNSSGIWEEH